MRTGKGELLILLPAAGGGKSYCYQEGIYKEWGKGTGHIASRSVLLLGEDL